MRYSVEIDHTRCTSCGVCRNECNHHLPVYKGAAPTAGEVECIGCLHCFAVCPQNAVMVRPTVQPAVTGQAAELADLVAGRRSCRSFTNAPVSAGVLDEITRFASLIPSGGNNHAHELTVLTDGETRRALEGRIEQVYRGKRKILASPILRAIGSVISDAETREFIRDPFYLHQISYLLDQFDQGADPIFYRAPVVVLVHSRRLIPTPHEDCVLAAYNMVLAAQTLGLGTCLVSLAQKAINGSRELKRLLGMDAKEQVRAVLVLGYPAVAFRRPVRRAPTPVNLVGTALPEGDTQARSA